MTQTFIPGKDAALEDSIARFQQKLSDLGFQIEEASWLNPVPNVWSVHIRDKECALCFTNGKGATKKAALASALGEYFERLSTNYFFADFWLGETIANGPFVHYPNEKWFPLTENDDVPEGLLDDRLRAFYDPENELTGSMLIDLQSGNEDRGICGLPFTRQSDNQTVYIPMNIIGNLYVSNGMSAGNTRNEARVQGLSEVFERYVKNRIIAESISLPEIPADVLARYPAVVEAIETLEAEGFPIFAYDGSLGGQYPVICVVLFNPANGTCFASFGAHPDFGVALERTVTELLQGRGLKDLDVFTPPTFDDEEVAEHTNLETHFIDSSGLISWDLFKQDADYPFVDWNFSGTTEEEFAEDGQQKWVTQDQATLVTQHGRLVKTLLGGDNLIEVNNLAADPLIKPAQIIDGATWTRTMGWTEYKQVRYATARSVFKWNGTDTVKVGSDETPVRVLDEEVSTDQARWHNRYWIDSEGQIRQSEQYLGADYFPVKTTLIKAAKQ